MARTAGWLWVGVAASLGACVPIPKGFDSPEPAARITAAVEAADRGDRSAIPALIGLLDSDDPATRLVAIRSLERLTGETLGYDHAALEAQREEAVLRWVDWLGHSADGSGESVESESVAAEPSDG